MPRLDLIVPVYDEAPSIAPFYAALAPVLAELRDTAPDLSLALLFVDDGSRDDTADTIRETPAPLPVTLVSLSRNFGKEAAMTAGLAEASGDAVVILDVDLQDPPGLIPQMVARWRQGAKVVLARRTDRSDDGFLKEKTAAWFYSLHNRISEVQIPPNVGDFRLMDREVVDALNALPENRRFMKGIFAWVGYAPDYLDYTRPPRAAGESKFSGWKLWRFAVEGITSFSEAPLVMWTYVGGAIALASMVYASWIVVRTLMFGVDVPGYASLLTGVLFLGGIQILGIGILGEYIGRIYSEVKRRPPYVVAERTTLPAANSAEAGEAAKAAGE